MKTEIEKLTEELLRLKTENEHNRNESDKRFDKFQEESKIWIKENRIRMEETTMQMKETDRKLDKIGRLVGSISNNQGDVAEEFFFNTISSKETVGNIHYDFTDKNITRKKGDIEDEFDIVLVNSHDVAIIETKYKAHLKDLDRLINKKYVNFKKLYPEYKNYNHHLGLASFYINDDVKEEALNNNVMVLQRKGDIIETFLPS